MVKSRAIRYLTIMVISIMLLGSFVYQASAKTYTIRLGYLGPADVYSNYEHAMAFAFKSSVEALTDGNVQVELFPNGILGSQDEMFEMTRKNSIQAVIPPEGIIARWYPEIQALGIPFLYSSLPVAWAVQDGPFGDELKQIMLQKTGLRTLGIADVGGFTVFATNKRPIRTVEDLKGLKIRTMTHEGHIATIRALGGSPTPMTFSEVYTSLQTGVIDGHFNPVSAMITFRMYEVQEYLTLTDHLYGAMYLMMNEDFFKSLPQDYQEALIIAGKNASVAARGVNRIIEANGLQFLADQGMTVVKPAPEVIQEMREKAQPVVVQMLEERFGKEWLAKILKAVEEAEAKVLSQD